MPRPSLSTRCAFIASVVLLLLVPFPAAPQGDPAIGRQLFSGARPFRNGGPACATCHSVADIPFPNGGAMGPDLTKEYFTLGPEGMDATLQTLYFPTMVPLFANVPLAPDEQANLKAFFARVDSLPPPPDYTLEFGLIALGGLGVLLAATGLIWKSRLRRVRAPLVERMRGGRA